MTNQPKEQTMSTEHTCYGDKFLGAPAAVAVANCRVCYPGGRNPAAPDMAEGIAEGTQAYHYAVSLRGKPISDLLDALVRAEKGNQYGSHDEQIQMIRAEIIDRVPMQSRY